ncbi:hypothetical protein W02_34900 [Nitrospira sp. KM1]|uniref:S1/P1 nuclease n=1 Tax=Nitrospira sp. KM1 TaxID=1936990 RepID=UPI0013A78E16|nr:S1/P1 nuclease [Nitrospira sp. KM1]BCA56350.1 hypothetical protein W02_34900 [Nitrospira sp. KM1]
MASILLAFLTLVIWTHEVFAWGNLGHEAIADAAQPHLSPDAAKAIAQILGQGTSLAPHALANASTWPDQVRDLQRLGVTASKLAAAEVKEALDFNKAFPDNAEWHFVYMPLGSAHYPDDAQLDDLLSTFTNPNDIVQMLNICVKILETTGDVVPWTKAQALRWLIHLVGDVHQPLHVTAGYYKTAHQHLPNPVLIEHPREASQPGVLGDRGGNELLFNGSENNNLHALWDSCLVKALAGMRACGKTAEPGDVGKLSQLIAHRMTLPASAGYHSSGDYYSWGAHWATDSIKTAHTSKAYVFVRRHGVLQDTHQSEASIRMTIEGPPSRTEYSTSQEPVVAVQLTKAAVRLADLLNHISWKP